MMSIRNTIRFALKKYASTVKIEKGGQTTYSKAFVEPLRRKNRLYLNDKILPSGYFDNGYALYIGDPKTPFSPSIDTFVTFEDKKYTVISSEEYKVGKETIYIWAILLLYQPMQEDDYDTN